MLSRIAPTPSGFLHLGNAASFLLTAAMVKAQAGQLLLRIDDMDSQRLRPDYVENILATLDHLGIQPDLGPRSLAELKQAWSQHHRLPLYQAALSQLEKTGLVYACDCSRKRLKSLPSAAYDSYCRHRRLPLSQSGLAWRVRLPAEADMSLPEYFMPSAPSVDLQAEMGDFVIRKKDGLPAYQLSSVVDDLHFGVTHIVRGADLLSSSLAQRYLLELLGESPNRWRFYHHPLLLDAAGEKLSKSAGAQAILANGQEKYSLDSVRAVIKNWLAGRVGSPEWAALMTYL